jgi:hypothetical protein
MLLKWLVRHCAPADQPWAVFPLAAPLVPARESPVEVGERDMGHAAPADKGLPRFGGPLGAPSQATRCSRGAKSKEPLLQGVLPKAVGDPLEPAIRSSIRAWSLAVYRAL